MAVVSVTFYGQSRVAVLVVESMNQLRAIVESRANIDVLAQYFDEARRQVRVLIGHSCGGEAETEGFWESAAKYLPEFSDEEALVRAI